MKISVMKNAAIAISAVVLSACCLFCACRNGGGNAYTKGLVFSEIEENGEVAAYSVNGSGKPSKNIKIPSVYNDKPVTAIGGYAFKEGAFLFVRLESITIPDSVTSIGERAFWGCYKLKNIYYGGTVAQWENIRKGDEWDMFEADYYVRCSDGNIYGNYEGRE